MKTEDMNCSAKPEYVRLAKDRLPEIQPLWEELNLEHLRDSIYFKDHYRTFTFKKRSESFRSVPEDDIRIDTVHHGGLIAGYCVSTVKNGIGEIESLFIGASYRGSGSGRRLVERALAWFEEKNCSKISVGVAHGHESVLPFYERFGFRPRMTVLELRTDTKG